jgi:hypothetical protein
LPKSKRIRERTIDWSKLPERFGYLKNAAIRYGGTGDTRWDGQGIAANLSSEDLNDLSTVYEEIVARRDQVSLADWVDGFVTRPWTSECKWPIFHLLILFEILQDRGTPPFNSARVRYSDLRREYVWTHLPRDLRYLISAAEKYGPLQVEDAEDVRLHELSDLDLEELRSLANQIRVRRDEARISEWLTQHPPGTDHSEACLIYWLLSWLRVLSLEIS